MFVGSLECRDVAFAKFAHLHKTATSPSEWLATKSVNEQIGHLSAVTTVSIWKRMN